MPEAHTQTRIRQRCPPHPDATDQWSVLMAAGRAGDARAYARLLAEVRLWLARYFRRRLPGAQADDAVQDTLIALHNRRDDFDCGKPLRPWLAAIARFKWVDQLRAIRRDALMLADDNAAGHVPSHEIDVLSCHAVRGLLGQLRPAQAAAIRMVKIDGLSIAEASAASGQSPSLVKINIHRGMKRLAAARDAGRPD
jgi:RNA polymerase sigma-70 factor (ECF subfamily)